MSAPGASGRRREFRRAAEHMTLGLIPIALLVALLLTVFTGSGGGAGFDFHFAYWTAGERVLHGQNPYVWTPHQIAQRLAFVYPALSALIFAPLSLLGRTVGADFFACLCIGLAPATLWTLNVRDWRIYGATLMWLPVVLGWVTANETLFLVLGMALAWRFRDRPALAGFFVAALVSLKPLMWPLGLWLLATRRWRAVGYGVAFGLALNLIAWWIVGFDTIGTFLHTANADTNDSWRTGYSIAAMGAHLGLGRSLGDVLMVLVSVVLAGALLYVASVRHDERGALTLGVALALASSPLVWSHYFALALVPLALYRPRMGPLWLVPILLWVNPDNIHLRGWQVLLGWAVVGTILGSLLRARTAAAPDRAMAQT
jgi:hypothetical protein